MQNSTVSAVMRSTGVISQVARPVSFFCSVDGLSIPFKLVRPPCQKLASSEIHSRGRKS